MTTDLILVGGGLANSLIAHRILMERPDFPLLVVERGASLGANHTWSFHDSDLTAGQRRWMEPLVAHRWSSHELRFPRRHRTISDGYNSVTSERLHEVVAPALEDRVRLETDVAEVDPGGIVLANGERINARAVIDGRGDPGGDHLDIAFQKFLGLFVRLAEPHRSDRARRAARGVDAGASERRRGDRCEAVGHQFAAVLDAGMAAGDPMSERGAGGAHDVVGRDVPPPRHRREGA